MHFKDQILDATRILLFEGQIANLSFTSIADKANISQEALEAEFSTLNDITAALSKRSISRLAADAHELSSKKGIEPLQKMISNDVQFFFKVESNKKMLTDSLLQDHTDALEIFSKYFDSEMPKFYEVFFRNNKELLPESELDIIYFSHFISHSLRFFNLETLESFESTSEGRKNATEMVIQSLFNRDTLKLSKF